MPDGDLLHYTAHHAEPSLTMSPSGSPHTLTAFASVVQRPTPWKDIASQKVAERRQRLAAHPEWLLKGSVPHSTKDVSTIPISQLTPREQEIVRLDATALVDAIRDRRYSAVEVLKAYAHAASVSQSLTNCLTEVFIEEGLERAAELDRHLEETGQVVGPLHGLPFSIKDHIMVKGHDTATGYTSWAFKTVAQKDAVAVDILRRAGAVLYVKTANPQTLLVS